MLLMRWMLTIFRLAVLITICVTAPLNGNAAGLKRLALVIANAAYTHTAPLNNPLNDATLISENARSCFLSDIQTHHGSRAIVL
jgi:hypothetical protein